MKNKEISKRVKNLRSRKGLTQEELAVNSGLSDRTIQRIENGETEPRGDSLKRLAKALEVSPDEILDWQVMEDKNILAILNLSQLSYLAFPLLGIIIPLVIWIIKKDKIKNVDKYGKVILNFQISWFLLLSGSCILVLILGTVLKVLDLPYASLLIGSPFFLIMMFYVINITLILINVIRIKLDKEIFYKPSVKLLN